MNCRDSTHVTRTTSTSGTQLSGPALLDSNELERHLIAVRNVTEASRNWRSDSQIEPDAVLGRAGAEGDRARGERGEMIRRWRGKEFRCTGVRLGYRYNCSPICVPDRTPEPPGKPDDMAAPPTCGQGPQPPRCADLSFGGRERSSAEGTVRSGYGTRTIFPLV